MILFSQENDYQFIKYKLGTELSQILENEDPPDMIDEKLNEYYYFNKIYEYFAIDYSYTFFIDYKYTFFENKLINATLIFRIDNNILSIYNEIIHIIFKYDNIRFIYSKIIETNYLNFITVWIIEDNCIDLFMRITKDTDIENNMLTITQSHYIPSY